MRYRIESVPATEVKMINVLTKATVSATTPLFLKGVIARDYLKSTGKDDSLMKDP